MTLASIPAPSRPAFTNIRLLRKAMRGRQPVRVGDRLVSFAAGLVLSRLVGVPLSSTSNFLPQGGEKGGPLIGI